MIDLIQRIVDPILPPAHRGGMTPRTNDGVAFDAEAVRRFHEAVFAPHHWPEGAVLAVPTILKGYGVRTNRVPVSDVDGFVELCAKGTRSGADVYVNVAPQRPGLDISARGGKKDALGLPALFADVDTADGAHKATNKPGELPLPTRAEAIELLRSLPIPITVLTATGGGLHAWYCLTEPLDHADEAGDELLRRWKATVVRTFHDAGFRVDEGVLADPARMLRVPGTLNQKRPGDPRPVRLLADDDMEPSAWEEAIGRWLAETATAAA